MSKASAFKVFLNKYGTMVEAILTPSASEQCSCWEFGWPNKDCDICGGEGYIDSEHTIDTKAFIFPLRDSDKQIDFINIGTAIGGQIMAYFSPDFDLISAQYVVWDDIRYKVTGVDRAIIAEEMIYRSCHLDKVD